MNDRFKFRIWNKSEMHYNDFVVTATGYVGKITEEFLGNCVFNQEDLTADNECILMQSTGLKDKNGKLIFEGDIIKPLSKFVLDYKGEIKFGKKENYQSFYVDWHTKHPIMRGDIYYWLEDEEEGLEVIGNIYENPELLKECENEYS